MNVIKINLPPPSELIISQVTNFVDNFEFNKDKKRWLDEFHSYTINSCLHHYDSPAWLTELIRPEFQDYFPDHRISGMIGIMSASEKNVPACMSPHCDRSRAVGLNYFIELGGDKVETVFYDVVKKIVGVSTNLLYNQVNPIEKYIVPEPGWYGYRVERCHSVENLKSRRVFVAIRIAKKNVGSDLDFDYNIDEFCHDYPHLIAGL